MSATLDYIKASERIVGAGHKTRADTLSRALKQLTGERMQIVTAQDFAGPAGKSVPLPVTMPNAEYCVFIEIIDEPGEVHKIGWNSVGGKARNSFVVYNTGGAVGQFNAMVINLT